MKNLYMHTIDGKPAMYMPKQQIVFVSKYNRISFEEMFVDSLSTIKRQQKASRKWREDNNMGLDLPDRYGYLRIQRVEPNA